MKTLTLATIGGLSLFAGVANAAPKSILINQAPVRALIESKLARGNGTIRLSNVLDARDIGAKKGVTQKAADKARQALYGLQNTGNGDGKNYVTSFGVKKLVVTLVKARDWNQLPGKTYFQRFIARDGKTGLVVARGNTQAGKLTWTRMKNEHSKKTPAERNAAP